MNARGEPVISLGLGEPDFPTPPEVIAAAYEAMRVGMTRYSNPYGLMELRKGITAKLARENNVHVSPECVIVTPGAKMALSLTLSALLEPGDEIIVIAPCYPSYIPQVHIAEPDAVVHIVDMRRQDLSLDLNSLATKLTTRTKIILLNSPHNPTGKMITETEIDRLAKILADHSCWIISDEVYERLNHSHRQHVSVASHPILASRTVTINGFSKTFAMTGWRIGYAAFPNANLCTIAGSLQQHTSTCVAPFIQKAAMAALALPPGFLDTYNQRLAANARAVTALTNSHPFLVASPMDGGLFAFVDISKLGIRSDEFASNLLEEEGVAVTPGIAFGETWDTYVRLSLAIESVAFKEGLRRLDAFVKRHGSAGIPQ